MKKYSILIFNWIFLYVLIKKIIKNSKTAQYEHLSVIFNFFFTSKESISANLTKQAPTLSAANKDRKPGEGESQLTK
jgi:hypothetical protein